MESSRPSPARFTLVFDTETSALPPRGKTPCDSDAWRNCRIVQIAWALFEDKNLIEKECYLVQQAPGFSIPIETTKIHGITTEDANTNGLSLQTVLNKFEEALNKADTLVAHNIEFDNNMMISEYWRERNNIPSKLKTIDKFCTMKKNTRNGERWPKLSVLYERMFGSIPTGCHRADVDVELCAKIYFNDATILL